MRNQLRPHNTAVGLPPGTLVHIGEQVHERSLIRLFDYDQQHLTERDLNQVDECLSYRNNPDTVTWIDIEGIHDTGILEKTGELFEIHPLELEMMLNTRQRPLFTESQETLSLILKMLRYDAYREEVVIEQVTIVLGRNYVLSLQEGKAGDVFDAIRDRIRNKLGNIRDYQADYLMYALIDIIVDHYFLTLEMLGERIEVVENLILTDPEREQLSEISTLKQELIHIRRAVWPLREAINALERSTSSLILPPTHRYLRSVYDHVIQIIDITEAYRDILAVTTDLYLSSINNRMTSIMNVLTIIMSIFIPLTFIVGVYGMNFQYMPELSWRWGYPVVWGVMLMIGLSLLIYFHRRHWL